jgi:protein-S-isoprenylcysteine O-methyltransferase Ste14
MELIDIDLDRIIDALLLCAMGFVSFLIFKEKQDKRLNTAMTFSTFWVALSLYVIDEVCVNMGFWSYADGRLPFHLLFVWIVIWGVVVVFFSKGKFALMISLALFMADLAFMPQLAKMGVFTLSSNWLLGEVLVVGLVALPALIWANSYYENKNLAYRNFMQVLSFGLVIFYFLPLIFSSYFYVPFMKSRDFNIQYFLFIISVAIPLSLPGLLAVLALKGKGRGTPYPLDVTSRLVRNGIYAYVNNPIQISAFLVLVAMSVFFQHWVFLLTAVGSLIYSFGFAKFIEHDRMGQRFGQSFHNYQKEVRPWITHWRPKGIANATIYFKLHCTYCQALRSWLERKNTFRLTFIHAEDFAGERLTELTYVDEDGNRYGGVRALGHGLGHVHLLWAWAGWILCMPGIAHLLQLIIDWMDLDCEELCEIPTHSP